MTLFVFWLWLGAGNVVYAALSNRSWDGLSSAVERTFFQGWAFMSWALYLWVKQRGF